MDYNLALDSRVFNYETQAVDSFLNDLFELIPGTGKLSSCRTSYTQCVLGDYCSVNYEDTLQQAFCNMYGRETTTPYNWSEDTSCQDFVLRECQRDSDSEFCSISKSLMRPSKEPTCKTEFKKYCERNPKDSLCFSYNERCLVNYISCAKSKDEEEKPLDKTFLKAKGDFAEFLQQSNDKFSLEDWWHTLTQMASDYFFTDDPSQNFSYSTPFQTCLENPAAFFQFESKMIVGDINEVKYETGRIQHFQLKGDFSVGNWLNWNAERRFAIDWRIGLGASSKALSGILTPQESSNTKTKHTKIRKAPRVLNDLAILSFAAHTGMGSSEGRGKDIKSTFSNMVNMVASEAHVKIHPTHFKNCLVIKPQPNAFTAMYHKNGRPLAYNEELVWPESFRGKDLKKTALSRPRLILCNSTVTVATSSHQNTSFTEKYYYISQVTGINETAGLLNPYDIRNRPFVTVLRGQKEFLKLFHLFRPIVEGRNKAGDPISTNEMPGNLWRHYPKPVERLVGLNLARRAFRDTGFHPGIHTDESWQDERDVKEFMISQEQNFVHDIFDWINKSDFIQFDVPSESGKNQIITE